MSFFCCNKINLSKIKNIKTFLAGVAVALKKLSDSKIQVNKIMIGGEYHKKYYQTILKYFYSENNIVFNAKNTNLSEFLCNLKYNLCNYGLFFYKEKEKNILKIYSGNCCVINKTQQNFIDKILSTYSLFQENVNAKFSKYKNYYKVDYLNFQLICKNKRLLKAVKKTTKNNNFKVVVLKNLKYFVLYKDKKINLDNLFLKYKKVENVDDNLIETLIKNNSLRVVNKDKVVYNRDIYNFDILKTLIFLSEKTYDDNFRKLVLEIKRWIW